MNEESPCFDRRFDPITVVIKASAARGAELVPCARAQSLDLTGYGEADHPFAIAGRHVDCRIRCFSSASTPGHPQQVRTEASIGVWTHYARHQWEAASDQNNLPDVEATQRVQALHCHTGGEGAGRPYILTHPRPRSIPSHDCWREAMRCLPSKAEQLDRGKDHLCQVPRTGAGVHHGSLHGARNRIWSPLHDFLP